MTHDFPQIGPRTMLLNARKLYRPGNRTVLLVLGMEDITERRRVEMTTRRGPASATAASPRPCSAPCCSCPAEDAFPGLEVKMLHEAASDEALVGRRLLGHFCL